MRLMCKPALTCALFVTSVTGAVADDGRPAGPNDAAVVQSQPAPAPCNRRLAQDFTPMTLNERLAYAVKSVSSPSVFLLTAAKAGINQLRDEPKEWGQGALGYGRRYGNSYAQFFISQSLQQGSALVLHEDNRYFGSGEQGFGRRLRYVIASSFLARHDDGSRHISISFIGGTAGAAFISRIWQPHSTNSPGDGATSFGLSMASRIGFNFVREFMPQRLSRFVP